MGCDTVFKDSAEEVLGSGCGEPIRAANVLDLAPRPASRTQALSNTPRNPSHRRELELKRLKLEAVFNVRFQLLTSQCNSREKIDGRGGGVGRALGVGVGRGVTIGVTVGVALGVGLTVGVGVGVGVGVPLGQ
jgi:hypothetical protein